MCKKIFMIFIFFIILFSGCTQRNRVANENITENVHENIGVYNNDLAETGIVDIFDQSSKRIYVTRPRFHGPEIISLQERLVELGFTGIGGIDGFYGPMTAGEVYFIKAALGFVDYYIPEYDWRPENYSVINDEIWNSIFDPENILLLRSLSQVRLFNIFPLERNPENNPNITDFVETQLPFTYPDWVPPWGMGNGRKTQREFNYTIGTDKISVIETREIAFVWSETIRDFTFQNGLQIRQSIVAADSPMTTVRFSFH